MELIFNHVHYRCADFAATRHFYCDVLGGTCHGFVELGGREHMHITLGAASLFFARDTAAVATPADARAGAYHIAFAVADHDAAVAHFKTRGAKFISEGLRPTDKLKVAFIEAPDGMQVELMEIQG